MRTAPDMSLRRDARHKGLTDSRPEQAIVQGGLISSSTNHVVTSTAATGEAGNIGTFREEPNQSNLKIIDRRQQEMTTRLVQPDSFPLPAGKAE